MTNAEINLQIAVKALDEDKLTGSARNFIQQIRNYDKADLKRLTPAQYKFLKDIVKRIEHQG